MPDLSRCDLNFVARATFEFSHPCRASVDNPVSPGAEAQIAGHDSVSDPIWADPYDVASWLMVSMWETELKGGEGVVHGSGQLARTLLDNGLVDDYAASSSRSCWVTGSDCSSRVSCRRRCVWSTPRSRALVWWSAPVNRPEGSFPLPEWRPIPAPPGRGAARDG